MRNFSTMGDCHGSGLGAGGLGGAAGGFAAAPGAAAGFAVPAGAAAAGFGAPAPGATGFAASRSRRFCRWRCRGWFRRASRQLPALLLRELKVCFLSGSPAAPLLGWWMPLPEPPWFLPRASPPGSMPLSAVFHRALVMSLTGPDWSVSKFSYSNPKAKAGRIQITFRCDACHNIYSP